MPSKTFIAGANAMLTQAETIGLIREMDITCVRIGDGQYRIDYRRNDPRRVIGDEGTAYFADSLGAAYDMAWLMSDRPLFIDPAVHIAKHREAVAAHAKA